MNWKLITFGRRAKNALDEPQSVELDCLDMMAERARGELEKIDPYDEKGLTMWRLRIGTITDVKKELKKAVARAKHEEKSK